MLDEDINFDMKDGKNKLRISILLFLYPKDFSRHENLDCVFKIFTS